MNYIVFDSYTGEVDFVSAAEVKTIEQTSEPGRYSFFREPDFDDDFDDDLGYVLTEAGEEAFTGSENMSGSAATSASAAE